MKPFRILIIDDHPYTCIGYELFLQNAKEDDLFSDFRVDSAYSIESALVKTSQITRDDCFYDLVILDIQLPPSVDNEIFSGEDIGLKIRELNIDVKILVITGLSDNYRLHSVFKSLNPEGLMVKTDIDDIVFLKAVKSVLAGRTFYSDKFIKLLRNQFSKDYVLDKQEREFLFLLSIGIASKDIPNHMPWSLSNVEKKKRLLREKLGVENKSVLLLLNAAKIAGFI